MTHFKSFIEAQFPVAKVSKESYKERMANVGQTLTGLGKWWGRKPLVLVRATILGLLMPASDNPVRDREIFLKLMAMDDEGLWQRKNKNLSTKELYLKCDEDSRARFFSGDDANPKWQKGVTADEKEALQKQIFNRLSYDEKLLLCQRPEHLDNLSEAAWADINTHLDTDAHNLPELVAQLGQRQFGGIPRVGDAFCGGGSIPFEAARLGCQAYGSDLNPVAALLTWAALHIVGGGEEVVEQVKKAQREVYEAVDRQVTEWGIEHNERGWRADAYLYCVEARDPQSGFMIPLAPSWVIGEKTKCIARLCRNDAEKRYDIDILSGVSDAEMAAAKAAGTAQGNAMVNPDTGDRTPIATLRGPQGLRLWENDDIVPRPDDVFQERLYCIRYVETYYLDAQGREVTLKPGDTTPPETKILSRKHYVAPDAADLNREANVLTLLQTRFHEWQEKGYVPSKKIDSGYNTDQPIRERGWAYWHQLFNARQLLLHGLLVQKVDTFTSLSKEAKVACLMGVGRMANWDSKMSMWDPGHDKELVNQLFSNQALNTLFNFGNKGFQGFEVSWEIRYPSVLLIGKRAPVVYSIDARAIDYECDLWVTDPPYADAINYHELGDFFLAWYEKHIPQLFPEWYTSSRKALAIRGSERDFRQGMVEAYRNLANHMPDGGAQVVMFTHQSSAVWADLALILWAAGLQVSAAWTIQTETSSALKTGNYVQGTVIMVLRKQVSEEVGFLSDIQADVEHGVREQLRYMTEIEDRDDPNFEDTDYQLAAYAAALRELTRYRHIEDIDIQYELSRERRSGEPSEIEKIIDSAVKVAMDYLVPTGFNHSLWRTLLPEERFYVKALEVQSHGEHRSGVYQEMARGYGLRDYKLFLKSDKANETRLMTAIEFGNKELGREGFGSSLLRQVLFAIRQTHQEENPRPGRQWLYTETPDYWGGRQRILQLLQYLENRCEHIVHWQEDVAAARLLRGYVENDSV
jgi:adenine-specific DNA methylase